MDYLVNLNLNKNELQNAVVQPLSTAPSSPKAGQIYYHSTDKVTYQYDGTNWKILGATAGTGLRSDTAGVIRADLLSDTSLGTIGTTSKLYAVGVDANGDLCVNVPWANDNTTYSLSGALSSHTFTTTLTPSSGSATTSAITFAAGTGISLTDSGSTITIANTVTNTDTKVNVTARGTTKAYLLGTTTSPTSSAQAVESVAETGVYFDTTAATLVATTFKGDLTGTASGNLTSNSTLNAAKLSGAIPSAVTATTQTTGDDSTKIATTAFVNASIASAQVGAAMFQGDAPTTFAPTNYKKGYYWIVKTAGTYVGQTCEVGDMIFAIADYNSAYSASDFTVVQYNITDGSTSKKGIVQLYDGIDSTSTSLAATANAVKTAYDLANSYKGTVTSVQVQATSPVQSSTSTASSTTLNTTISLADAYGDTKNPYGTKTANYVLAGPTSGSAAAPTFRALVAADIPSLTVSKISDFPGNATQSVAGLMSAADKTTLDSLSAASTGAITHTSLTIAANSTSVSASGVASKLITYQAYQGGEAVIVDYDGTNFSVASAAASDITIKCVVTV